MMKQAIHFLVSVLVSLIVINVLILGSPLLILMIFGKTSSDMIIYIGVFYFPMLVSGLILSLTKGLFKPILTVPIASIITMSFYVYRYLHNEETWIEPLPPAQLYAIASISVACSLIGCCLGQVGPKYFASGVKKETNNAEIR